MCEKDFIRERERGERERERERERDFIRGRKREREREVKIAIRFLRRSFVHRNSRSLVLVNTFKHV